MNDIPKNHDRYWVPGLARGLRILNVIAAAGEPLTVAEIARRTDLNRSSVFRLAYTLQYLGYIEEIPGGRGYDLSSAVLRLGYAYLAGRDIVAVARPVLDALADETGLSAHLGALSGRDTVYLVHAPGRSAYVSTIGAGDRLPAHASPMGLAILSGETEEQVQATFEGHPIARLTEQTPGTVDEIIQAAALVRASGYAISRGTVHPGGQSVAAPVRGADGSVKGAVGISGPDSAFAAGELEERFCPLVVRAAAEISRRLGYVGEGQSGADATA
jgi:DNA-binding IclR family transcriptional regulator